jgi:hypothetical protein
MRSRALGGSSSNGKTCEERVPVEDTESAEEERDRRPSSACCLGTIPKAIPP